MTKNNELIWIGGKHAVLSYLKSKCKDVVEFRTSHSNLKENLNNKIKIKAEIVSADITECFPAIQKLLELFIINILI